MKSQGAWPSLLSVALALGVCFGIIALTRQDVGLAVDAYAQMLKGGLGDFSAAFESGDVGQVLRPWGESAGKAGLLVLTGLSVAVALSVGLFNLGAQGQFLFGAITAAVLGSAFHLPFGLHPLVCLLGAALAGAAYAWVPTILKLKRGVHEVISTIMLNWIASSLIENWWVVGPLRASGTHSRSGTEDIAATAQLPRLLGDHSRLHAGFLLAVLSSVALWVWWRRSVHGYEARVVGLGPDAARASGLPANRRTVEAMLCSGALAGLAGALWVLGTEYKFPATVGGSYGFDGITMALLGQGNPLGVLAAALAFGALRAGGTRMQLLGVHQSFPELIQGLALLFIAGSMIWRHLLRPRMKTPTPPEPA
jgi:general nucleoside transport system permease protein